MIIDIMFNILLDILLFFMAGIQKREDQAVYYDAHVLDIQRRVHNTEGCQCIFVVRYDHDFSEVNLQNFHSLFSSFAIVLLVHLWMHIG